MEQRVVAVKTVFEKRMARLLTSTIAVFTICIMATLGLALLIVLNRAEFGEGVRRAIWRSMLTFGYVVIAEAVVCIVIGRQIAVAVAKRLAGPITRITAHLKRVVASETKDEIVIRREDDLFDIIQPLNKIIANYSPVKKV
ncbi:MAG: hypothetical protein AB1349_07875 [Elusimicrobiota bacterium]